jgi:chemotaxis protein MotB
MITFADLLSLMLAFFVLLFAMSKVEIDSWKVLVEAFSNRLNPLNQWTRPLLETERTSPKLFNERTIDLDYLAGVLQAKMSDNDILAQGILHRHDDSLVVSLPGDLIFQPGQIRLSATAQQAMVSLGSTLKLVGNSLELVGHVESTPTDAGSAYASKWDLSLARALAFAGALRAAGYGYSVKVLGAADGGAGDISSELPEAMRQSLARRIDLVIRETSAEGGGNAQ